MIFSREEVRDGIINPRAPYSEEGYVSRGDIIKLSDSIYELGLQLAQYGATQEHLVKSINELTGHVDSINERNVRQDTIFALICKVWKISPYIISMIFLLSLAITGTSIDISGFMVSFLQKYLGK